MKHRQGTVLETLRRMDGVIAGHPELESLRNGTARAALNSTINDLMAHAESQQAGAVGSRGETARQRNLRLALVRLHIRPIVTAAKLRAAEVPELHAITMPSEKASAQQLLAKAAAMRESAGAHEQTLIEAGLETTFVAQLDAAISALRNSYDTRALASGRRSGATSGLTAAERKARGVIRILDAQVRKAIGPDNKNIAAEWAAAVHVARKPGLPAGAIDAAAAEDAITQVPPGDIGSAQAA